MYALAGQECIIVRDDVSLGRVVSRRPPKVVPDAAEDIGFGVPVRLECFACGDVDASDKLEVYHTLMVRCGILNTNVLSIVRPVVGCAGPLNVAKPPSERLH